MKRRMEQLLNGRFIYQAPRLILSDTSLELTVNADSSEQGEFFFAANDNSRIKGMMSSSHRRIVLEKDKFSGNAIHIRYVIDTRGLKSAEDFEGIITVSSSLEDSQSAVTSEMCIKLFPITRGILSFTSSRIMAALLFIAGTSAPDMPQLK